MNSLSLKEIGIALENVLCDKVKTRNSAFDVLFKYFESKRDEFVELLSDEDQTELSWESVYETLHRSTKNQASRIENKKCTNAAIARNSDHTKAIKELIDLARMSHNPFDYNVVLEKTFDCFDDKVCRENFGESYMKIASDYLGKSVENLSNVKLASWSSEFLFYSYFPH